MSDTPKSMEKIRTPSVSRKRIEAALHNNEGIQFKYPGNCNQISLPIKLLKKFFFNAKAQCISRKGCCETGTLKQPWRKAVWQYVSEALKFTS